MGGTIETVRKGEVRTHTAHGRSVVILSSDAANWAPRYGMVHVAPVMNEHGLDPVTVPLSVHDPVTGFVHVDLLGPVGIDELGDYKGKLVDESMERLNRALMVYFDMPY
jgi:mRNA-degrading endonuclease toxin of MazEF toxin-antitoxin module